TIALKRVGFMVAFEMECSNLHKRIAISIISVVGSYINRIFLGFIVAYSLLFMWFSNTVSVMLMFSVCLDVFYQVYDVLDDDLMIDTSMKNFRCGKAMMLGIAYSASPGGISTIIGTPPNATHAGAIKEMYGIELSFATWMLLGVPIAWIFIMLVW